MSRYKQPLGMVGGRALLVSVIKQATIDLSSTSTGIRQDAIEYFAGDEYQQHLAILDMGAGIFPTEIDEMTRKRIDKWRGGYTPAEAASILDGEVSRHAAKHGINYTDAFTVVVEARPNLVANYERIRHQAGIKANKMPGMAEQRRQRAERHQERLALDARIKEYSRKHGVDYPTAAREVMSDE